MPCQDCNDNYPLNFTPLNIGGCDGCGDCMSTKGFCYNGPNLDCSGIETGDSLDVAFSKLDEQMCSAIGDYSAYQKNCLPAWFGAPILTEATFVDAITSYTCTIATNLQTFTGVTFPAFQDEVTAEIEAITGPGLVCTSAGVIISDSLQTVLTKYCTKFSDIDEALDVSTADWDGCFTVGIAPTTVLEGFNEVLSQICQVRTLALAGGSVLPTFNNVGSCLASPTTTDTLVATINKIKTRLCATDTYLGGNVDWGCLTALDETLEGNVQFIAQTLNDLSEVKTTFSADFVVEATDEDNPCAGVTVSLATPLTGDRFVAYDSGDTSPGTLVDKIVAGIGIDLSESDDTNQMLISSTGVVAGSNTDTDPAYLIDKLNGSSNSGISIVPTYNPTTKKVDLNIVIDEAQLCFLFGNCSGGICTSYTVTPVGASDGVNYVDCDGNTINLTITGATTFCAKINTVYAPASTIVNVGSCTPNPNTSGFLLINNSSNIQVSSVNTGGSTFYTTTDGAYPVGPGATLVGVGVTSAAVRVVVASGSGVVKLYKNNILQQTLTVSGAGNYTFTAVTFAPGDSMKVIADVAP